MYGFSYVLHWTCHFIILHNYPVLFFMFLLDRNILEVILKMLRQVGRTVEVQYKKLVIFLLSYTLIRNTTQFWIKIMVWNKISDVKKCIVRIIVLALYIFGCCPLINIYYNCKFALSGLVNEYSSLGNILARDLSICDCFCLKR